MARPKLSPLLKVLPGGGEGEPPKPRIRIVVDVEVQDEARVREFAHEMHVRWHGKREAQKWLMANPPLEEAVVEALVILNANPPDIGLALAHVELVELA